MSMLTDRTETDPDEIEREIIKVVGSLPKPEWAGWGDWTRRLNGELAEIAKAHGFQRYAKHLEIDPNDHDHDQGGEWLYDMTWLHKDTGEIQLALESEWSADFDHDFTKLLSVKARHRAFIFCHTDVEGQFAQFIKQVCDLPQTQGGDRFLLIGVDMADHFAHKVIVASGPSYEELRKAQSPY